MSIYAQRKLITADDVRAAIAQQGQLAVFKRLFVSFTRNLLINECWTSPTGKWHIVFTDTETEFPFRPMYRVCLNTLYCDPEKLLNKEEPPIEIDEIEYTTLPEIPTDMTKAYEAYENFHQIKEKLNELKTKQA